MAWNIRIDPLLFRSLFFAGSLVVLAGCTSVKKAAVNQVADALASGGTTFAADDDPELVKQAVPFSLKLMESLLSENPRHQKLLLATCSGFTQYAFAFVQQDADELEATNYAQSEALRLRAKKLYRRARDYGLRGLEVAHAGWTTKLAADPRATLKTATKADVPLLYWTAAAWGSYISASKDDPAAIGEMVQVEALIDRALELDEAWSDGTLHSMLITLEMSRTVPPTDGRSDLGVTAHARSRWSGRAFNHVHPLADHVAAQRVAVRPSPERQPVSAVKRYRYSAGVIPNRE